MSADTVVPLLNSLFDRGKQFSETPKGLASDNQVYGLLEDKAGGRFAEFREVESRVVKSGIFSTSEPPRHLRLPDVEEGGSRITPLAYLDGNFSQESPYFRLQVVLVIHASRPGELANKIALRFETPEQDGKHSYYHSQICVTIQKGATAATMDMEMEPTWFPTSHPAWPMDAESPAELLVCLILALYGKVVGGQIISEAGSRCGRDLFDDALGNMRTKFREPAPAAPSERKARKVRRRKRS